MKVFGAVAGLFATLGICLVPTAAAAAGKHDGSAPLLCVPANVTECSPEGECQRVTPESVNLPVLLKVNLKGMTVRHEESGRQSPIQDVRRTNGRIVLHGSEGERAWVLTIREDGGRMWAAVAGDEEAFVISGVCVKP